MEIKLPINKYTIEWTIFKEKKKEETQMINNYFLNVLNNFSQQENANKTTLANHITQVRIATAN